MKIITQATNIELTPSINRKIEDKIGSLQKFLKKIDPAIVEARVEVGKITKGQRHGKLFRAEVNLRIGKEVIRVENSSETLYNAIDRVKEDLAVKISSGLKKSGDINKKRGRKFKELWQTKKLR